MAEVAEHESEMLSANNPAMTAPECHRLPARRSSHFEIMSSPAGDIKVPEALLQQSKHEVGWRRVVRNFTPSWFSVTMGTGIVSVILYSIPFQARWLYWLSVIFFTLNAIIFSAALTISVLRYTLYPEIWEVMIRDGNQSLFLGTFPMGFATLVNAWIHLCVPYWGHWAITFAWVCWIIDSVVATATAISLPILLISASREQALHRITAVQLLPIVAPIVAAGTGAQVAGILTNPQNALGTLIASYIMWGIAVPLVYMVLVMYYQRLALHKLPPREVVVSSFLPLGPCGMGGYTIMHLGVVARTVFPQTHFLIDLPAAGDIVYVMGTFVALIMWSFAMVWLCFALISIHKLRPFPFNMGWWGFTFPLGVLSTSTIQFGIAFSSLFFKVLGTIFGVSVILLWCVVTVGTIRGAIDGKLFYAPCLANLPKKEISHNSGDEEKALPN